MTEELIVIKILVFLPWALMLWIFLERKVPLLRRIFMIGIVLILFSSFTVFYSLNAMRHDRELVTLENVVRKYEDRYGVFD